MVVSIIPTMTVTKLSQTQWAIKHPSFVAVELHKIPSCSSSGRELVQISSVLAKRYILAPKAVPRKIVCCGRCGSLRNLSIAQAQSVCHGCIVIGWLVFS